ncbi:hypothetical protein PIB30_113063, partial [Stylosanthes scabra]|nr:hypothetical protein [Stylosanthes scabra]
DEYFGANWRHDGLIKSTAEPSIHIDGYVVAIAGVGGSLTVVNIIDGLAVDKISRRLGRLQAVDKNINSKFEIPALTNITDG